MHVNQGVEVINVSSDVEKLGRGLFHALAQYRGPVELGWYDFITLFRRSFLGPTWATIQMALWIGMITLIFHERLGDDMSEYALYVGLGFYAWDFISWSLSEGPNHLTSKGSILKNLRVDLSAITVRRIAFLFFRGLFQLPVPIFLLLFLSDNLNWNALYVLPVIVIYLANAYAFLTVGGVIGIYFPDFKFIVPTLTRFLFFTTPIFWRGDIGMRKVISDYNPFSYFIELVRAPLSGVAPSLLAWSVAGTITVVGLTAALVLETRFRQQIIYRVL